MPKKIYKVDQFHGGLNTHSEWRDIANNELSRATDIQVSNVGKIRLMGGVSNTSLSKTYTIQPGYGLFSFSSDWQGAEEALITTIVPTTPSTFVAGTLGRADYHIVYDSISTNGYAQNNRRLYLYSYVTGDGWTSSSAPYYFPVNGTSSAFPTFYSVDGIIRFSDGVNMPYAGIRKWFGHINKERFKVAGRLNWTVGTFYDVGAVIKYTISGQTKQYICISSGTAVDGSPPPGNGFTLFSNSEFADEVVNTWLLDNAEPQAPTDGSLIYTDSSGNTPAYSTPTSTNKPTIVFMYATSGDEATNGSGWNEIWDISFSYVYDGNQESKLFRVGGGVPWSGEGNVKAMIGILIKREAGTKLHARITGINVYIKKQDTDDYFLQTEIDLYKGLKNIADGSRVAWSLSSNTEYHYINGDWITSPSYALTYETNSGLSQEVESIGAHYKTAVVANRMAYIGNVVIKENGVDVVKSDAMMKSLPNKFDIFPVNRMIEASVNDGDEIIKLEEYADRILQFKTRKMHLINISQEIEFLEDTFMYKGVSNPNATCKTDFGIAWVNENGCYFYNGKQVANLLEKKNRTIILEDDWSSFITNNSAIGYLQKTRSLIVLKDYTNSSVGDIYMYNFTTQSWTVGDSKFNDSSKKTNFSVDHNGDLLFAYDNSSNSGDAFQIAKWSDTPLATTKLDIRTKDLDFELPTTRKKIYKIYITHKNAGQSNIRLRAEIMSAKATSGQGVGEVSNWTSFSNFVEDRSAGDDQVDSWITQIFIPPSTDDGGNAINWSNVYSLRLYILPYTSSQNVVQTVPAGFEINDICIVYRPKAVK